MLFCANRIHIDVNQSYLLLDDRTVSLSSSKALRTTTSHRMHDALLKKQASDFERINPSKTYFIHVDTPSNIVELPQSWSKKTNK
jgi:hypothetical protein